MAESAHELEAVIGLEIHVQLATKTKMFCGCELSFGDEPNIHTCPICLAHPGVLPVPNEQAILYALQIGAALDCEIAPRSIFHRKNYFYPDNPKAYQISQYDIPICGAGKLGDVRIHRAHLEEDAAKTIHVGDSGRIHGSAASLVDFNRGGTPLVEIVTEPDLRDAAEAAEWARLLRETVRQLGVSDVNMEEGSLRVDANVSVRPAGSDGARHEDRAEEHEQLPLPAARDRSRAGAPARADRGGGDGRTGDPPLRPAQRRLTSLRSKEEAHDYRYFPEPDLVPIVPTEEMLREAREALPELPAARIERYEAGSGLSTRRRDRAGRPTRRPPTTSSAPPRRRAGREPKVVANWVTGELAAALRAADAEAGAAGSKVTPERSRPWPAWSSTKKISHGSGKTVLAALVAEGGDPAAIVEREGLAQISGDDGELDGDRRRGDRGRPRRRRRRSAPATARRSAPSSAP